MCFDESGQQEMKWLVKLFDQCCFCAIITSLNFYNCFISYSEASTVKQNFQELKPKHRERGLLAPNTKHVQ